MKEQLEEKNTEMGNVITRSEEFIQKNQKKIIAVICAIVAVALIIFCYYRFYKQPRELKAAEALFTSENYFNAGDYQTALDGDAATPGLVSVIDNYGSTKAGNLAKYYAGIANLRLGNYDAAAKYLDSYSGKDLYTKSLSLMAQGDAKMELGNTQDAVKLYVKAAETNTNELTTPTALFKAGMGYMILGDNAKALTYFKQIKSEYPRSTEWPEIDKYIALAEAAK